MCVSRAGEERLGRHKPQAGDTHVETQHLRSRGEKDQDLRPVCCIVSSRPVWTPWDPTCRERGVAVAQGWGEGETK